MAFEGLAAGRGQVEDVGELRDAEHRGCSRAGKHEERLGPGEPSHDSVCSPGEIPPTSLREALLPPRAPLALRRAAAASRE